MVACKTAASSKKKAALALSKKSTSKQPDAPTCSYNLRSRPKAFSKPMLGSRSLIKPKRSYARKSETIPKPTCTMPVKEVPIEQPPIVPICQPEKPVVDVSVSASTVQTNVEKVLVKIKRRKRRKCTQRKPKPVAKTKPTYSVHSEPKEPIEMFIPMPQKIQYLQPFTIKNLPLALQRPPKYLSQKPSMRNIAYRPQLPPKKNLTPRILDEHSIPSSLPVKKRITTYYQAIPAEKLPLISSVTKIPKKRSHFPFPQIAPAQAPPHTETWLPLKKRKIESIPEPPAAQSPQLTHIAVALAEVLTSHNIDYSSTESFVLFVLNNDVTSMPMPVAMTFHVPRLATVRSPLLTGT